jgi:hypothetical protein
MPNGSKAWNMTLYIDGIVVAGRGGGTGFADAPSCSGDLAVGAGMHTCHVTWSANEVTQFHGGNLTVLGAMR